ncbi:ABC-type polysaccharide/polyol phosphate transport system ATPase subunit [Leucobacter luti]|uniref:ABC transporter ATP-binding protein n=1 Tax=Leucobacter luti TaxID=340320 RepID=UPI0010D31093|nr:ABC transporter ATP-binding protein [Leucobacter luti]MCW2289854.1 ABC-type polysaccharide/polyol phosphate transport system ATPase subunit [Leucobacter luti]TCK36023.1 ABC-type polysaccharide/polyol phosphate transport system ATPase subunit [Leucobacter luti]
MPSTSNPEETASPKPAIVIHDVRKTFTIKHANSFKESIVAAIQRKELSSQFHAIDGLSLEVPEGQSIALLGRNGSGKSTTLKMLSGVMRPDQGWIRTRGRIAGLLEVGAGFNPNLSGRDNVYLNAAILGMTKEETDARFDDILEFSEIGDFIDTEVKHYSSGMYSRLGFSVAVHTELDVLLVDEILSVGDASFRLKCIARMNEMRAQGKTMFVVSHSAGQVQQLCDRGVVLQRGKIVFDGPIDEAIEFIKPGSGKLPEGPVSHLVRGGIRKVYERDRRAYGRPLHNSIELAENGGGWYQRFENGIITRSLELDTTRGITKGSFLNTYLENDGPAGPWGFIAGNPRHGRDGLRTLAFQNGVAEYSPEFGVRFVEKA